MGNTQAKHILCYLQGLTSTGGYKTIKSQNLLLLWGLVVGVHGEVEIKFWKFEDGCGGDGTKVEQEQIRVEGGPSFGNFVITL